MSRSMSYSLVPFSCSQTASILPSGVNESESTDAVPSLTVLEHHRWRRRRLGLRPRNPPSPASSRRAQTPGRTNRGRHIDLPRRPVLFQVTDPEAIRPSAAGPGRKRPRRRHELAIRRDREIPERFIPAGSVGYQVEGAGLPPGLGVPESYDSVILGRHGGLAVAGEIDTGDTARVAPLDRAEPRDHAQRKWIAKPIEPRVVATRLSAAIRMAPQGSGAARWRGASGWEWPGRRPPVPAEKHAPPRGRSAPRT